MLNVILIALTNFASVFLQSATGFGYAILSMFLMPLVLPYTECLVISSAVILVMAIQMSFTLRKHINFKAVLVPLIFCLIFMWPGRYIIAVCDEMTVKIIMGVFLILLAPYFFITQKYDVGLKQNFVNGMIIGILTGLATGMFTIMGPFLTIYFYGFAKDNLELKANLEFSFLVAGTVCLGLNLIYLEPAAFTLDLGLQTLFSCLATLIAGFLGLKIYRKLNKKIMKYIILIILPIMGLVLIFR